MAPLPQPKTASRKSTLGHFYSFVIPRGSQNPIGAYMTARALTTPAADQSAAIILQMAPTLRQLLGARQNDPGAATAYASALYARGWLSPSASVTDSIFSSMINNVISGRA